MTDGGQGDGLGRRAFVGAAASGLATGALGGLAAADAPGATHGAPVTIIHDTHFHGRFEDTTDPELNVARYYSVIERFRERNPNPVFVGVGDDLAPSSLGLEYEGEHMIEALNEMDLDVDGVGNHEFDFGAETATRRFEDSEFPWVVANLLTGEGDPIPGTERWTTIEVDDDTVGVFGLASEDFHDVTDYPDDWQVLDAVEAAREAVGALREAGSDLVVLASHLSSDAHRKVAEAVDGIDVVVGSHSGQVNEAPRLIGGTFVSEFGDEFDYLGVLTFDPYSGNLIGWGRLGLYNSATLEEGEDPPESSKDNHRFVDVQEIEENGALRGVMDEWLGDLEARLGDPYFETEVELDATFATNYARESRLGNLITDAMREVGDVEADVAIQNAGGIRSDSVYGPGEITGLDVLNVLPFPNTVEIYEVTGQQLRSYLQSATRPLDDESRFGAQPAVQVSGLQYEWRGHDGEAEILEVFVNGDPLDPEATYRVSTNDFVADRSVIGEGELVLSSDRTQGPFVLEKLAERGTVAPRLENRILRVDEDLGTAEVRRDGDEAVVSVPATDAAEGFAGDSFEAVIRTGEEVAAASATGTAEGAQARFAVADLQGLAESVEDPELRLFGGFDPDEEHYGYVDADGNRLELPVSAAYETFRLKASVPVETLREAVSTPTATVTPTAVEEDTPGLGPIAGGAGVAGGAYLYRKYADEEE